MKKAIKYAFIAIDCLCAAVLLLISPFAIFWTIGSIAGHVQDQQIKKDVFEYVLENKDTLQLDAPRNHQEFIFTTTGSWDTYVEYGYYYSEDDTYSITPTKEREYKNGYRIDTVYGDPLDWYYTEKICDNWYYYEYRDV